MIYQVATCASTHLTSNHQLRHLVLFELDQYRSNIIAIVAFLLSPALLGLPLQLLNSPLWAVRTNLLCDCLDHEFGIEELPDPIARKQNKRLRVCFHLIFGAFWRGHDSMCLHRFVTKRARHTKTREVLTLYKNSVVHPSVGISLRSNFATTG